MPVNINKFIKFTILIFFSEGLITLKAFPTYVCPITGVNLKENILSLENENLVINAEQKENNLSKEDPVEIFSNMKEAITLIREEVSEQLKGERILRKLGEKNDPTAEKKEVLTLHGLLFQNDEIKINYKDIYLNLIKKEEPKVFSYAKYYEENSKLPSFEIYSISGEFKFNLEKKQNKKIYFANVVEEKKRKLSYFNPNPEELNEKLSKKFFENIRNSEFLEKTISELMDKYNQEKTKLGKNIIENKGLVEDDERSITNLEKYLKQITKMRQALEEKVDECIDINSQINHEDKLLDIIYGMSNSLTDNHPTRYSDAEAKILEKVLDLTPVNNEQVNKDELDRQLKYLKIFEPLNPKDLSYNTRGTLKIYTSLETCPSCKNAYILFSVLRPNIKLEIYTLNKELQRKVYKEKY